jgi:hypothetical protein
MYTLTRGTTFATTDAGLQPIVCLLAINEEYVGQALRFIRAYTGFRYVLVTDQAVTVPDVQTIHPSEIPIPFIPFWSRGSGVARKAYERITDILMLKIWAPIFISNVWASRVVMIDSDTMSSRSAMVELVMGRAAVAGLAYEEYFPLEGRMTKLVWGNILHFPPHFRPDLTRIDPDMKDWPRSPDEYVYNLLLPQLGKRFRDLAGIKFPDEAVSARVHKLYSAPAAGWGARLEHDIFILSETLKKAGSTYQKKEMDIHTKLKEQAAHLGALYRNYSISAKFFKVPVTDVRLRVRNGVPYTLLKVLEILAPFHAVRNAVARIVCVAEAPGVMAWMSSFRFARRARIYDIGKEFRLKRPNLDWETRDVLAEPIELRYSHRETFFLSDGPFTWNQLHRLFSKVSFFCTVGVVAKVVRPWDTTVDGGMPLVYRLAEAFDTVGVMRCTASRRGGGELYVIAYGARASEVQMPLDLHQIGMFLQRACTRYGFWDYVEFNEDKKSSVDEEPGLESYLKRYVAVREHHQVQHAFKVLELSEEEQAQLLAIDERSYADTLARSEGE